MSAAAEPARTDNNAEHVKCVVVGDGAVGTSSSRRRRRRRRRRRLVDVSLARIFRFLFLRISTAARRSSSLCSRMSSFVRACFELTSLFTQAKRRC
jgi:hypothetical protein